ncbi:MAG TPA: hypothetical protein VK563_04555 [Puia sp.]|nr:hypothetical protein [Puia sp.]
MKKYLLLFVLSGLLFSCKSKKVSLAENDEEVDVHDFIEFFQPLKLPWAAGDTLLRHKESDSIAINYKLFLRFVPDSVLSRYFGREGRPRLYAAGRIGVPEHETYLLVKALAPSRKALLILCFDKKNKFSAARPVIYLDNESGVTGQVAIDPKYTITVSHQRKAPGGQIMYKKDAYIYNDAGLFMLIMTESNDAVSRPVPVYNPIDTLPHKHKFTGDYSQDKKNIVSVRDGKDPSRILFFVHFEKDNGECKGELKGQAKFISPSVARYMANGDPCMVEFSFSPSGVSMKETGGCGNHRDIRCFFEGYYEKHKEAKARPGKKKG